MVRYWAILGKRGPVFVLRPPFLKMWAMVILLGAGLSPVRGQEGGIVGKFCQVEPWCVDDALEIVFDSGTSTYDGPLGAGAEIPIRVLLDARSPEIQGYSWAVKHDSEFLSLIPERVTTAGTIIDPESPDTALGRSPFRVTTVVDGGFFSAVILAMTEKAALPLGRDVICHAAYRVTATPPCTVIRFVHQQLGPPRSPSVAVNITTSGLSRQPRVFRHGVIRTGDCPETCDDHADNDGDGLADCDDPECSTDLLCTGEEICDDGLDNNANGKVDCQEPLCAGVLDCPVRQGCADGIDNDKDGALDGADPDCAPGGGHPVEACDDGADNDGDSLIDCEDPYCWQRPGCRSPEVCDDGADNDRDSRVDCNDRDCSGHPACPELEACDDVIDNDEDGLLDCADPDCRWENPCVEACNDGIDNDGDGFVDGLDGDCYGYPGSPAGLAVRSAFIRGDADGSGRINVLDAVVLLQVVVLGEAPRFNCLEALNTNLDPGIDVADALPILGWIFLDGPPLPAPFPACGQYFECAESSAGCR